MQSTRGIVEYGPGVITGNIVPLSSGQIDLGSADFTFGNVWCTNIIGSVSDSLIDCDQLRFPLTGPVTHRLLISGGNLNVDNGSGGNVTLAVGNVRTNVITAPADLSLNPTGTNINVNSKNLHSVGNMITDNSITPLGFPKIRVFNSGADIYGFGLQSDTLSYESVPASSNHVFYVANTERIRINASALQLAVPITTGSGNLILSPAGANVVCSNKSLTSVAGINMGTALSALGGPKLRLYDDGILQYGIGMQGGVMSYEVPSSGNHVFYVNNVERANVTTSAFRVSVPITTASGNLVLNPAGANIDCSNKTITNATIAPLNSATYTLTNANFTNTATLYLERIGRTVSFRISSASVITCNTASAFTTLNVIANTALRPATGSDCIFFTPVWLNGGPYQDIGLRITSGGTVTIQTVGGGNFSIGNTINFTFGALYGCFIV
jgi:hypothetical protein